VASKNGVSGATRRKIFKNADFTCKKCGIKGIEVKHKSKSSGKITYCYHTEIKGIYLSVDHIIPRYRGGTSDETNLQCLCTKCNTEKGTKGGICPDTEK
jgi:5-methylcytosine-specific restriction endonuclease McrA